MAKPTAPTELGTSKVLFGVDPTAVTPAAFAPLVVQSTTTGEATYPAGWLGVGTHRDGDTVTQPGGFTGLATAFGPLVLMGAKESTTVRGLEVSDVSGAKALKVDVVQSVGSAGGTSSSFGAAFPASGTASGFSDGTNMQGARVFDADSGAGTQLVLGVVARKIASGGSVEAGTATDPWRVDPTGTTTQPVSGTVTANAGTGPWPVTDNAGSLTVDAPVATPVNVQIGDGTFTAAIHNLAANDALSVAVVDGSGAHITAFGGGIQYTEGETDTTITGTALLWEDAADTLVVASAAKPLPVSIGAVIPGTGPTNLGKAEDAAHVNGDTGVAILGVRNDADAVVTTADADYSIISVTSRGAVKAVLNSGGGLDELDDFAFSPGATGGIPGLFANTTDEIDAGDFGVPKITTRRAVVTAADVVHSTANSTTTPLAGSATFTGSWESVINYAAISVTIDADQDGSLFIEFSDNGGTNTDFTWGQAFSTGITPQTYHIPRSAQSVRIRYINGASAQASFRLQTHYDTAPTGVIVQNFTWEQHLATIDTSTAGTKAATESINQNAVWVSGDVWGVGDGGITAMVVRKDTRGNLDAGIVDGDYTTPQVTATGDLRVRDDDVNTTLTDRSQFVKITDGTFDATVRNLAANDALNVAIVDGAGNQITSFGGGVQYDEGDIDTVITGTAVMWEGAGNTLTVASDVNPLPVYANINKWGGNSLTGSSSTAADAKSTVNTGPYVISQNYLFNGTTWDRARGDITNGLDVDVTRVSGNVTVVGTGTFAVQAAQSGTWTVTPSVVGNGAAATAQRVTLANDSTGILASLGTITGSVVPGTGATHLGKAEDAVHASGDTGVMSLGVRGDIDSTSASARTAFSGTAGDYTPIATTGAGAVRTVGDRGAVNTQISAVTFNNTTTTSTGSAFDVSDWDRFSLSLAWTSATGSTRSTAINVRVRVQFTNDNGTTWFDLAELPFASLYQSQASIGSGGINEILTGRVAARRMRIDCISTGTTAAETITLTAKVEPYRGS